MTSQYENNLFEGTIVEFLSEHFGSQEGLSWVFRSDKTGIVTADEFFDPLGFLPAFVQMAKNAGDQIGFDCEGLSVVQDDDALLGLRAVVEMQPKGNTVMLLIDAIERLCGPAEPGRLINPQVLYDFLVEKDRPQHQELLSCISEP